MSTGGTGRRDPDPRDEALAVVDVSALRHTDDVRLHGVEADRTEFVEARVVVGRHLEVLDESDGAAAPVPRLGDVGRQLEDGPRHDGTLRQRQQEAGQRGEWRAERGVRPGEADELCEDDEGQDE